MYTKEEKLRMDHLMSAFAPYIRNHKDFDIAYTEKSGFLCLITAPYAEQVFFPISTFDEMLWIFFDEILRDSEIVKMENVDFDAFQRDAASYLQNLEAERQYAHEKMQQYIAFWKKSRRFS